MKTAPTRLALLLVLGSVVEVAPAQEKRLDHSGMPLPPGAIARLGRAQLRHSGSVVCVAVSPDGQFVASGSAGGLSVENGDAVTAPSPRASLRLFEVKTGKMIREIESTEGTVSAVAFDAAGTTLFAGVGNHLWAWNVATGKQLWRQQVTLEQFHENHSAASIVERNDVLVTIHIGQAPCLVNDGSEDTRIIINPRRFAVRTWDKDTGKPRPLPPGFRTNIGPIPGRFKEASARYLGRHFHEAVVAPDGHFVAALVSEAELVFRNGKFEYRDRSLRIYETATGKVVHSLDDNNDEISALTFAADSVTLAMSRGNDIDLLRLPTGQKRTLAKDLKGRVSQLQFVDTRRLAARNGTRSMELCDIDTGKRVTVDDEIIGPRADNGKIAAVVSGSTIRLLDVKTGKPLREGHEYAPLVRFALSSPNLLLSRDRDRLCLWDTRSWKLVDVQEIPHFYLSPWPRPRDFDRGIALERQLYVKEIDKGLELRDLATDRPVRKLEKSADAADSYFAVTGNRVVVRGKTGYRFYDVESGKLLATILRTLDELSLHRNLSLLSPQGRIFATTDSPQGIDLYDVNTGRLLRTLKPHLHDEMLQFRFSECDSLVLAEVFEQRMDDQGGYRSYVVLWNAQAGELLLRISVSGASDNEASVTQTLAVSHDQRLLAVAAKGKSQVDLWEIASATKRRTLVGHDSSVVDVAFAPDDRRLASSSHDSTTLIWDLGGPLDRTNLKDRLDEAELTAHWQTLLRPEADRAEVALWSMVHAAGDSVAFLKKHLHPLRRPSADHVRKLVDELDSADFRTRARAEAELQALGELVLADLRAALKQQNPLEMQRRLETLVQKASQPFGVAQRLAQWRALEVLEKIATPAAKDLLRELTQGDADARLTTAARSVLERLETRAKSVAP